MNIKNQVIFGIIAVIVLGGGAYVLTKQIATPSNMMNDEALMMEEDAMMKDDEISEDMSEDVMSDELETVSEMSSGAYEEYSEEKLVRAENGDVVLFFHASWCPSCRGLNADLEQNLESIPSELSILKLNYDTETDLKKKYGVTYQHTLVQVDKDGNLIKKWSGSPTLAALSNEVQ